VMDCYPDVDPGRIHVIHNGIDPEIYRRQPSPETLIRYGVDATRPYAFFNGRITRQKGLPHLLNAVLKLDGAHQVVIAASSPDTPELETEVNHLVERVRSQGRNLVWIDRFISREDLIHLHSHASAFVCPSVYEPFGLVILEAMACETAVVASRVGGIPEIVVDGETGFLVDFDPNDADAFATALAQKIQILLDDPKRSRAMGEAGRRRVVQSFGWPSIAARTADLYESLWSAKPRVS
jgi:alpha-maltose-1-phosphate synthase